MPNWKIRLQRQKGPSNYRIVWGDYDEPRMARTLHTIGTYSNSGSKDFTLQEDVTLDLVTIGVKPTVGVKKILRRRDILLKKDRNLKENKGRLTQEQEKRKNDLWKNQDYRNTRIAIPSKAKNTKLLSLEDQKHLIHYQVVNEKRAEVSKDFYQLDYDFFKLKDNSMRQKQTSTSNLIEPLVEFIAKGGKKLPVEEAGPLTLGQTYSFLINVQLNPTESPRNIEYAINSNDVISNGGLFTELTFNQERIAQSEFSITPKKMKDEEINLSVFFLQNHRLIGSLPLTFKGITL